MPVTYSNRALEGRSNLWKYSTHNMGQSQTHLEQPPSNHKNMVTTTPVKYGNMGVTTGKKMTMAGALIGEKLAHLRADMRFGLYRLSHPLNDPNVRIVAAQESTIAQKSVATERRRQQEAKAREIANRKRALVREQRARHSY